jgi:hypothetical protein
MTTKLLQRKLIHLLLTGILVLLTAAYAPCQTVSLEKLTAALQHSKWAHRALAIKTIRALQQEDPAHASQFLSEQILTILIPIFPSEPNNYIRSEMVRAFIPDLTIDSEESVAVLRKLLADPDPIIRAVTVYTLLTQANQNSVLPSTVDFLLPLLEDPVAEVRASTSRILQTFLPFINRKLSPSANVLMHLADDLKNPDPVVRLSISEFLNSGLIDISSELKEAAKKAGKEANSIVNDWNKTTTNNTKKSYMEFADKYPQCILSEEAKRRIDDPGYAFLQTVALVLHNALFAADGFKKSYAGSPYILLLKDLCDFMEARDLDGLRKYITKHPDSPFIAAAHFRSPLLLLKQAGGGVVLDVKLIHTPTTSSLPNAPAKSETSGMKALLDTKKKLAAEGITAQIMNLDVHNLRETSARFIGEIECSETAIFDRNPKIEQLTSIFNPTDTHKSLRIIEIDTGFIWSRGLELDEISQPFDIIPHLGKGSVLAYFLLTADHIDFLNTKQREEALAKLQSLLAGNK